MITRDEWDMFCGIVQLMKELPGVKERHFAAQTLGAKTERRASGYTKASFGALELWMTDELVYVSESSCVIMKDTKSLITILESRGLIG